MKHFSAGALTLFLCMASTGTGVARAQQAPATTENATTRQTATSQTVSSPEAQPSGLAPGVTTYDYSQTHAFPNILAPYTPEPVPEPSLSNSQLMHQLSRDGKLYLSLDDAIALALENNLTIAVERFLIPYSQLDLLRARSGGASRGIPIQTLFQSQALFAGAVGAGLSSSASGGSGGGGAFATGGAINIGTIACCDPIAGFNFGWSHSTAPLNFSTVYQASSVGSQQTAYSGFFGQGFLTGTSVAVGLNGNRQSSTSPSSLFNPEVPTGGFIGIDQQLLNGFGYRANAKFI